MANNIVLRPGFLAPTYANAITTPAGGGGTWAAGTYSFIVVADYSTAGGGTDLDYMGALNYSVLNAAGPITQWQNITVAGNDRVLIDWTAPARVPTKYRVYYQAAASYDFGAPGILCIPTGYADGAIAGTVTSVVILDDAGYTANQGVLLTSFDATAKTVTIAGIDLISFGPGTTIVTTSPSDTETVASVRLVHNQRGWETEITYTGTLSTPTIGTTNLTYNRGPATFTTGLNPGVDDGVTLGLVSGIEPVSREQTCRLHNGELAVRSYAESRLWEELIVTCYMTAITGDDRARDYKRLQRWQKSCLPLRLDDANDAGGEPLCKFYDGRIHGLTYMGNRQKNSETLWGFSFKVDGETEY